MGQNLSIPDGVDFDPNNFTHWNLPDIEEINKAFRLRNECFAVDKVTLIDLIREQYEGIEDELFDELFDTFSGGADTIFLTEALAGITSMATGMVCTKVVTLYRLFDLNGSNAISWDESIVLVMSALSGIVRLQKVGELPKHESVVDLLTNYWHSKRVFDYQTKLISETDFQKMVMDMLRECWMQSYGPCRYSDQGCEHGYTKQGELRFKQTWLPDVKEEMWELGGKKANGVFHYLYKHNEYYLHNIGEPQDPDDRMTLLDILEVFGVLNAEEIEQLKRGKAMGARVLNAKKKGQRRKKKVLTKAPAAAALAAT
jgi:hypothetical protein